MNKERRLRQFSRHFQAMGTDVGLWLWNRNEQLAQQKLTAAERFFRQTEARLSRFRPDSELSRCNGAAGQPFAASPVFFDLVGQALAWREATDGIFDPAVLHALVASGYDRPFSAIEARQNTQPADPPLDGTANPLPCTSSAIRLGPGRAILMPAGVGLDLGGIAKGWAAQQAAHRLGIFGACLVDAGGDIASVGTPPSEPWVVAVADPQEMDHDLAVLTLHNEAVATSSRTRRRWTHDGKPAHHLIDPRTGAPAATNLLSVTVVAPRLPDAEVHAKCALILGETAGLAYLREHAGLAALLVTDDGRHLTSGPFAERF